MATKVEQAMHERREQARREAEKKFPGLRDISFSYFGSDLTVEVKDKSGHWRRFRHVVDEDIVAAEAAEASGRRREVVHGEPA